MFDRSIVLNNGVKIPQLGLGTWFIDDDKAADAVKAAVEIGYRHIDTAVEMDIPAKPCTPVMEIWMPSTIMSAVKDVL